MDMILPRDDTSGPQQIPETAWKCAGLMKTKKLFIHAGIGYILIMEPSMPAKEQLEQISSLREFVDALLFELAHASQHIHLKYDWEGDLLEMIDEDIVHALIDCGASLDGLRLLLTKEGIEVDDE